MHAKPIRHKKRTLLPKPCPQKHITQQLTQKIIQFNPKRGTTLPVLTPTVSQNS